jgi:hypothetical protein
MAYNPETDPRPGSVARMAEHDNMPPHVRLFVHEAGLSVRLYDEWIERRGSKEYKKREYHNLSALRITLKISRINSARRNFGPDHPQAKGEF